MARGHLSPSACHATFGHSYFFTFAIDSRDKIGQVSVYERVEPFSERDGSIIREYEIMRLEALSAKPIVLNYRFVLTTPNHSDDPALTQITHVPATDWIETSRDHVYFDAVLQGTARHKTS